MIFENNELSEGLDSICDRYFYPILSSILFLSLFLRIWALLDLKTSVYFDFMLWDERVYHTWAAELATGTSKSLLHFRLAPLPAYVMALVYWIFSPDIYYIRILNIIFGVLTCFLVYHTGKEMANRTTGLIACLIAAIYKPFIFYSIVPLKTALSVFLFALTIYLFVAILNRNSFIKTLILGITIGLMLNVRPNCIVLIPLMPLCVLWISLRRGSPLKTIIVVLILYVLGFTLSTIPFAVRNYRISGRFTPTTSQSGFALYLGNNLQNPSPYFRPVPFASASPFEQGIHLIVEASRRAEKKLTEREASSFWARETIKIALDQPVPFIKKISRKILVLFNRFEAGDHYHIGFVSDFVRFFRFPFLPIWAILPFGMAGMVTMALRSKKFRCIGLVFLSYASTLVIFFTSTRFRLPLMDILIPLAVMEIGDLFSLIKKRQLQKTGFHASIVAVFFIVAFIPVRTTDDMTPYFNTHAIALDALGQEEEAIRYWKISSNMNKQLSVSANLYLANKYFIKGLIQEGLSYLDKIPDDSFGAADKYEILGDMMFFKGDLKKAIRAYEKSLDINAGRINTRKKLVRSYWKVDKQKALEEADKLQYFQSFYEGSGLLGPAAGVAKKQ
ncbi:MAG: glycosyltransferase family 39 protein [Pseudomonadota bacterium]